MTTVAFDGVTMAADTLATDVWGGKEKTLDKIWQNKYLLIGCAGESGQISRWLMNLTIDTDIDDLIQSGYAPYNKDSNDPHLMVVDRLSLGIYRHHGGAFMRSHHKFFAIGSGRDTRWRQCTLARIPGRLSKLPFISTTTQAVK